MELKAKIIGLKFRWSDGALNITEQRRILEARQQSPAGIDRVRAGDDPSKMEEYLAMRRPSEVKVELLEAPLAVDISRIILPEMIAIPAGEFKMGSSILRNESPIRYISVSAFKVGKYPVTNGEYRVFLEDTGKHIDQRKNDPKYAKYPVVEVSWFDAFNYCKWLSEKTGRNFRLLTEAEWEYAARGNDGRVLPWSTETNEDHKTVDYLYDDELRQLTREYQPVGMRSKYASPFGVENIIGDVFEWVNDWYARGYDAKQTLDPNGPTSGTEKVMRGGNRIWFLAHQALRPSAPEPEEIFGKGLRASNRFHAEPENIGNDDAKLHGFRLAESIT